MRQFILIVFLLLSIHSFSQTPISDSDKIATFCKVWGFLKYHHPAVAKGKYDWDKEFLDNIKIIEQPKDKEEINKFYYKWILGLGKLKKDSKRNPPSDAILSNYGFGWVKDKSIFTSQVTELLLMTKNNSSAKNHYVKRPFFGLAAAAFVNEKPYKDSIYPSKELRLLILARYWNIVNYFYPYKYLTDTKWQKVITEFVPKFINAKTIKAYHLALLELIAKIDDSHAGFNEQLYGSSYKIPPFKNKIVNDTMIVLDAYNDSICKEHDIRYGDAIVAINGKSIKSLIAYYSKYISSSNYASLCAQIGPIIIWSDVPDSSIITCERNGIVFAKMLPNPRSLVIKYFQTLKGHSLPPSITDEYKIVDNKIGYINLGKVKSKKDIKKILRNIQNTSAVILDIRNYPDQSIFRPVTNFFCTSKNPFAKFAAQSIKYPGALVPAKTDYCGKKSGGKYKGKVVVLTDETTMSFAEYFTMALRTIPNVILIGSHTAGADGSNNRFVIQGNIITSFSDEAVYYPDGGETQRKGIIPDINVLPTIEGIRLRKDEVLEKAIEVLSK